MKTSPILLPRPRLWFPAAAFAALQSLAQAQTTLYWDTNGSSPGSSGTGGAVGTWSIYNPSNQSWSTSPAGTSSTQSWTQGAIATFSAGSNATGAYDVGVRNTMYVSGLNFNLGNVSVVSAGSFDDTILPIGSALPVYTAPGVTAVLRGMNFTPFNSINAVGSWLFTKTGSGLLSFDRARVIQFGQMKCSEGITLVANSLLSTPKIEVANTGTASLSLDAVNLDSQPMSAGGETIVLGVNPGASGTLNLVTLTNFFPFVGDMVIGKQGAGTLNISGSSKLLGDAGFSNRTGAPARFILGSLPGSSGVMNVNASASCTAAGLNGIFKGSGSAVLNLAGGKLRGRNDQRGVPFSTSVPVVLTGSSTLGSSTGETATFSGAISGSGSLTVAEAEASAGAGTIRLTGGSSYTGDTLIYGGLTVDGSGASLGIATGGTNKILATGNLTVSGGAVARPATSVQIGTSGVAGSAVVTDAGSVLTAGTFIEIGSSGPGTLNVSNGGSVVSATTTALGVVNQAAAGTANITGVGSSLSSGSALFLGYYGSGGLSVGAGGSITAGSLRMAELAGSSGTFTLNQGGTFNVGGASGISQGGGAASFTLAGGMLKVTGSTLSTTVPMTLSNNSLIDTSGVNCVLGGTLTGTGGLTKTGGGTLYLNLQNFHSGGTAIIGGQIVVPSGNALGTGPVNVAGGNIYSSDNLSCDSAVAVNGAGSSLTAAGYMEFGLGGTGTLAVTNGGQVSTPRSVAFGVLGGGTLGLAEVSGAGSALGCGGGMYIGYLSSGGVTVSSGGVVTAGSMLLAAGPASQGFFALGAGGTLNIGGSGGIAKSDGSAAFFFSGGLLKVTGSSLATAVPMTLQGQTSTVDTSGMEATLSGPLGGPGLLTKTGAGILYLTSANALTGGTTLQAGTLSVTTPTSLGTGALAFSGGTLDLAFTGTAAVQSLTIDGIPQAGGTWGGTASSAPNKTPRITGTGLLNVVSSPPPTFNAAATTGLSHVLGSADINLATATGATPPGGTFTGDAVNGVTFGPSLPGYGYGLHTITYTAGGQSATFTIAVIGGLTLEEEGGSIAAGNLAPGGIAFAKDVYDHPNHTIPHLNDGRYGNSFSWIGVTANSYAGVRFGATPIPVSRIAFGRDNTGAFTDRCLDYYTIQYTADPNPEAPSASWLTLGAAEYLPGGTAGITAPARRHLFSFPSVSATGLRVVAAAYGTAIDEIEIYPATGLFASSGLTLLQEGGTQVPDNLAPGGTAFSKDEIGAAPHATTGVNNGTYGNSSSWIGGTANSFVGIALPPTSTIDRIAFGRDNTAGFTDRASGRYTLQYTSVPSPGATTPDASWTTLGILDYQSPAGANFAHPAQRHLFGFPAVPATGIRIITPAGAAIDEIEVSLGRPLLQLEDPSGSHLVSGTTVDFGGRFPAQSLAKTFTLTNSGSSTITLGTLTVDGSHPTDFAATTPGLSTLTPGTATTFTITFTPGQSGPRSAAVHLTTSDPAVAFDFSVTGAGLTPTFNTATNNSLMVDIANGLVNLPATTGVTPTGGTFSGPGVSGDNFDPTAAGFGIQTLTYSYGGVGSTFKIIVTGGLTLLAEGGTFAPGNLAPAGTAFAKDVIVGYDAHAIPHLNDATSGNDHSWIGDSADTFAGISLGPTPVPINRIAFGRDNLGLIADRCVDHYILQYTTMPDPGALTTAWTSIGAVDYHSPAITNPALRHLFSFPTVNATGLRIITATAGTAIDEIEIYSPNTPRELWRLSYFNSTENSGGGADDADPNKNGIPNLIEYALGGQPVNGNTSQSILPTGSRAGNHMRIQFTRLLDRSDLDLTIQASANLSDWTDFARSTAGQPFVPITSGTGIEESGSGNTRTVIVTDPVDGTRRFLRLSVTPTH